MLENYHTHTARCRHAVGTEEEYVLTAIAGGMTHLGFSDHTPFFFPGDYYSKMRMFPEQFPDYTATVLALKEKYAEKIQIHLGLEVEYYPDRIPALLEYIEPYGIEYLLLGQHWVGNEQNEPYCGAPTDSEMLLARYCDQIIDAMDTGLFSYIAHPDLLKFVGDAQHYRYHMGRLCQAAKEKAMPVEINLLGVQTQRHYPRALFWEIAGDVGCDAVLGCDAHRPEDVWDPVAEAQGRKIAAEHGLRLLENIPVHSWKK